jgi:cobyrinic acid a,c-diamide synthase
VSFQDNADLMRYFGAEMVPFSPLADSELPRRIGGLYITGAYLKSYGEELARNESIKRAILDFADAGGVIYSEGAGTAFLCRTFQPELSGEKLQGVGLIPADAYAVNQPRSFIEARTVDESILGSPGSAIQGLKTGEWALKGFDVGPGSSLLYSLQIFTDEGAQVNEGYSSSAQSCATLHFLHFGSNPAIAETLVEAAAVHERVRAPKE